MKSQTENVLCIVLSMMFGLLTACSSPSSRMEGHIEELTELMEDNMEEPEEGIEEIHEYLRDNLPAIFEDVGTMLVDLDECESNSERQELVESWAEDLEEAVEGFQEVSEDFAVAVFEDPDAAEKFQNLAGGYEALGEGLGGMLGGGR